ncbi:MAG: cupin domain-containing protein [Anaerolineales bacterium]|jgi:quercetin dioxygenase-like cupin family protein
MTFINLAEMDAREIVPGYQARFLHGENMTLAYWEVEAGAELPEHSHPQEQIANVLEGEFELTIDGETQVLLPGQAAYIPGNVPHSGQALTACRLLDAFQPARDDYR